MATACVNYLVCSFLPCAGQAPAEVSLCVPATKVAPHLCGEGPAEQTYDYRYIDAILTAVEKQCNTNLYKYTFCFDDEQVLEGQQILGSDITGVVCKDCLTKWVEDKVGNEVTMVENEDGSITFTSQHGCEFTFFPGEEPS